MEPCPTNHTCLFGGKLIELAEKVKELETERDRYLKSRDLMQEEVLVAYDKLKHVNKERDRYREALEDIAKGYQIASEIAGDALDDYKIICACGDECKLICTHCHEPTCIDCMAEGSITMCKDCDCDE